MLDVDDLMIDQTLDSINPGYKLLKLSMMMAEIYEEAYPEELKKTSDDLFDLLIK